MNANQNTNKMTRAFEKPFTIAYILICLACTVLLTVKWGFLWAGATGLLLALCGAVQLIGIGAGSTESIGSTERSRTSNSSAVAPSDAPSAGKRLGLREQLTFLCEAALMLFLWKFFIATYNINCTIACNLNYLMTQYIVYALTALTALLGFLSQSQWSATPSSAVLAAVRSLFLFALCAVTAYNAFDLFSTLPQLRWLWLAMALNVLSSIALSLLYRCAKYVKIVKVLGVFRLLSWLLILAMITLA